MKDACGYRILAVGALLTGFLLSACSKPGTPTPAAPATAPATANWVRVTTTSPGSPARLKMGAQFTVHFEYGLTNEAGALIMVDPITGGSRTPDQSGHGSPRYPAGTGTGVGYFGALTRPSTVREVRVTMKEFGTSRVLAVTNASIEARWE